jgi:alpha-methylacyl-CoA racemase
VTARAGTIELAGIAQPAPAPRFDRTPGAAASPPPERGSGGADALQSWGFDKTAIEALRGLGVGCL